jgi:hypothetical protein
VFELNHRWNKLFFTFIFIPKQEILNCHLSFFLSLSLNFIPIEEINELIVPYPKQNKKEASKSHAIKLLRERETNSIPSFSPLCLFRRKINPIQTRRRKTTTTKTNNNKSKKYIF